MLDYEFRTSHITIICLNKKYMHPVYILYLLYKLSYTHTHTFFSLSSHASTHTHTHTHTHTQSSCVKDWCFQHEGFEGSGIIGIWGETKCWTEIRSCHCGKNKQCRSIERVNNRDMGGQKKK